MTEAAARDCLNAHEAELREKLYDFVRIPSVSTDPAYRESLGKAATYLADYLRQIGFDRVTVNPTPGHLLTGGWMAAPGEPTILVYGHYDVQPPDPLDLWKSDPIEPDLRDGRIYGRGVSDDKGPLMVALGAMEALTATSGAFPCRFRSYPAGNSDLKPATIPE